MISSVRGLDSVMCNPSQKVSVIVLNWNNLEIIEMCLDSLLAQTYDNLEIVVVDNASTDGSLQFIREKYPQVVVSPQSKNLGFAGGVNRGIEKSSGEYVALLNSDAQADPNWISMLLVSMLQGDRVAACGSKMLDYSDRKVIDSTGIRMFSSGRATDRGYGEIDVGQYDQMEEIFGACGGAVLFDKRVIQSLGGFDENFFVYLEDVDLAWRLRNAGYKTLYCPEAIVYHMRSRSTSKTSFTQRFYGGRNRILILLKNMPVRQLLANFPIIFLFELTSVVYDLLRYRDFAQFRGKLDAFRNYSKFMSYRKGLPLCQDAQELIDSAMSQLIFEMKRFLR